MQQQQAINTHHLSSQFLFFIIFTARYTPLARPCLGQGSNNVVSVLLFGVAAAAFGVLSASWR